MEKQTENNQVLTKANTVQDGEKKITLSPKEAEEFQRYKKQKRTSEIAAAFMRTECAICKGDDVKRVCERAVRLQQAAVRMPLTALAQAKTYLRGRAVKIDCAIGGNGETLTRIKACEARHAMRNGAKELTVTIAPSQLIACRYGEIKKELKKLRRVAKKADLKVRIEGAVAFSAMARVARMASEIGIRFFSVDHFPGCEKLKLDLMNGCALEVSSVNTLSEFKKMLAAGVGRIVTDRVWEIYSEWMKEVDRECVALSTEEEGEKTQKQQALVCQSQNNPLSAVEQKLPLTSGCTPLENRARLEGSDLKFL